MSKKKHKKPVVEQAQPEQGWLDTFRQYLNNASSVVWNNKTTFLILFLSLGAAALRYSRESDPCSQFGVVRGNPATAKAIVLGEFHNRRPASFACAAQLDVEDLILEGYPEGRPLDCSVANFNEPAGSAVTCHGLEPPIYKAFVTWTVTRERFFQELFGMYNKMLRLPADKHEMLLKHFISSSTQTHAPFEDFDKLEAAMLSMTPENYKAVFTGNEALIISLADPNAGTRYFNHILLKSIMSIVETANAKATPVEKAFIEFLGTFEMRNDDVFNRIFEERTLNMAKTIITAARSPHSGKVVAVAGLGHVAPTAEHGAQMQRYEGKTTMLDKLKAEDPDGNYYAVLAMNP